ncbi:uncharacterized protein LOC111244083 isoform X2 [Varroa destructor]|uniref:Adenomatous polyposis coli protein n=1 Tax=Varroa destructor TaxID=109461 RepID=A0A7M7J3L8_VARDE|nr:uncharacterized protein LOC111244083 isoform X2 [Varroa destructor]
MRCSSKRGVTYILHIEWLNGRFFFRQERSSRPARIVGLELTAPRLMSTHSMQHDAGQKAENEYNGDKYSGKARASPDELLQLGNKSEEGEENTPDWSPDTVLWRSLPTSVVDNRSSRSSSGVPTSLTDSTAEEDHVLTGTAGITGVAGVGRSPLMASSLYSTTSSSLRINPQLVNTRVEMVYQLLSSLASEDRDDVSATLENMTSSKESCLAMRQSGCIPLLVQLLHGATDEQGNLKGRLRSRESRSRAGKALRNIVHALPEDKKARREVRVLKLLEQVREFCNQLENGDAIMGTEETDDRRDGELDHPNSAVAALMKLSFDEEHRHAMCHLGGLQAIAELVHLDYIAHGHERESCILVRRYSGMALTNLTFGDGNNKAALCSMRDFMNSLVAQFDSHSEDLKQVTASVLRNLSWRADSKSRVALRDAGGVLSLTRCMMSMEKEATLKSVLSALWNLSAHCTENKIQICSVDGSLAFLVSTLTYRSHSKTLAIVENGGGILRNISSYVATQEEYRAILRRHSCLEVLLQQLKSPSLTVVSNACGTLWNLSARCPQDQTKLWELGAVGMLRNLVNSKHKMISMGSSAALKNLLTAQQQQHVDCSSLEGSGAESRLSSIVSDDALLFVPGHQYHKTTGAPPSSGDDNSLRSQGIACTESSESTDGGSAVSPAASRTLLQKRAPNSLQDFLSGTQGPMLLARKARNLKQQFVTAEDAKNLSELCDNIEASPKTSPVLEKRSLFLGGGFTSLASDGRMFYSVGEQVSRSCSRTSLRSAHSEPGVYIRPRRHSLGQLHLWHLNSDPSSTYFSNSYTIDWSTASAFLASSEGTRAASARRRPASSSLCVRPTSTYASFISSKSIFEDKEDSSPAAGKQQCTPKREPRTQTQEPSKEQKAGSNKGKELKEQKSREGERVAEEVAVDAEAKLPISSPMKEPLTDSQSSSTTPLKKSKVFQVKRPTESPPPPPIAKKKTLEQGQGNNQQSTTTKLAHALGGSKELSTKDLNRDEESMETQSSAYPKDERTTQETVGLCGTSLISDVELTPVVESKPSVPARTVKSIPTPPPTSPVNLSRKSSGNNNDFEQLIPVSDKSPPASPLRRNLTNKHLNQLKTVEIEDDSSIVSDLGGVQPPSYFNDLASMASSCASLELGDRSPVRKFSLKARPCWNADEWSPKSCENLDNVMPPSGLNSVECLSLRSSANSEMLLNANPPSFLDDLSTKEDVSFDDRTHDIEVDNRTRDVDTHLVISMSASRDEVDGFDNVDKLDEKNTQLDERTRDIVNHNEDPIYPRVNTDTYTQQYHQQPANIQNSSASFYAIAKPANGLVAHLLDDPTEIGSDAFLSDAEGEDLPYDSTTDYFTCQQSSDTLRASHFQSCYSGQTRDATVGSSENLTTLDNTLTFDVSTKRAVTYQNSYADLTYDATLVFEPEERQLPQADPQQQQKHKQQHSVFDTDFQDPADDECSVVSSVDDATYDISSPQSQTPARGQARIVKPIFVHGLPVIPGSASVKPTVIVVTGKNSPRHLSRKSAATPPVPIRQTRASALRASRAQSSETERSERGTRSNSSSPARSPPVSARLSSPANRRPLPRTASSPVSTTRTPIGGRAPQVASPLASRSSSLNSRTTSLHSADNMRPLNAQRMTPPPSTRAANQLNDDQPLIAPKPALTKQGTFTKESGGLSVKSVTPPVPNARTIVPIKPPPTHHQNFQSNKTSHNPSIAVSRPVSGAMHKSSSVNTNMTMTRNSHPILNRTQSDAAQMARSSIMPGQTRESPIQRVPLAMRTTAASRARAAAIAQSKMQPGHVQRVVLTRRNSSSGDRQNQQQLPLQQLSNNLNNNQQIIENNNDRLQLMTMGENPGLMRSGTYEKINEVGSPPFEDRNHNEQVEPTTTTTTNTKTSTNQPVRPSEFWSRDQKNIDQSVGGRQQGGKAGSGGGFLKKSMMMSGCGGGRRVADSSSMPPIVTPRSSPSLKSPCDIVTKIPRSPGAGSVVGAPTAAVVSPFNYRPRSTPTTPNGSKIPMMRSDTPTSGESTSRKNSVSATADEEGYIVAKARLVTTV